MPKVTFIKFCHQSFTVSTTLFYRYVVRYVHIHVEVNSEGVFHNTHGSQLN